MESNPSSWTSVDNWKRSMASLETEYEVLLKDTHAQRTDMEAQSSKLESYAFEAFHRRDQLIDAAYEALNLFVSELLTYADGDTDIGSKNLPTLPIVVDRFKSLAKFCEGVVDQQTLESVVSTQEIGEDAQIIERIKKCEAQLKTTLDGLANAVPQAWNNFEVHHGYHMNAQAALYKAEERRSEFFYGVFGDRDIDNAVDNCRNNESVWHKSADDAWAIWDHLRRLNDEHRWLLGNNLNQLSSDLTSLADGMRASYIKVGERRKVDRRCWFAARSLQYHVETNNEYTSRDEALRHVFQLLHTVNDSIDSDEDVVRLKATIERNVDEHLGKVKAEELHKAKAFIPVPGDLDF